MYSVVLAAMLTAGTATPAWGHGCCGGCHGCYGCHGCWGCGGGCYGCYGCSGCWGCYGCSGCYGCYGCSGCWGCYGCYGCGGGCYGYAYAAPAPAPAKKVSALSPDQATVIVQLPTDATLSVDGSQVPEMSAERTIITPDLRAGQEYYYTLRAEAVREGRSIIRTKRVTVRAGRETHVDFGDLTAVRTASR